MSVLRRATGAGAVKLSELPGNSYALGVADRAKHAGRCFICGGKGHKSKACDLLGAEHFEPMPRCRCGLMLPCMDCLPSRAADFQAVRMRASGALGDTYVDPSDDRREKDRMRKRAARAHLGAATTTGMETHQRRRG